MPLRRAVTPRAAHAAAIKLLDSHHREAHHHPPRLQRSHGALPSLPAPWDRECEKDVGKRKFAPGPKPSAVGTVGTIGTVGTAGDLSEEGEST